MVDFHNTRVIRVFISSTFKDMQAERDYLVKKVFPVLKDKAERRDVALVTVDLRWGITEKESKCGKVLDICLKEIDNSYPFFIGILGNRYGWCPGEEDVQAMAGQYDWLMCDIEDGLSMTEIEMQYGVFRNPREMNAHFYIKHDENHEDETDNPGKLRKLKEVVRRNGRYPVDEYDSAEDLGNQVNTAFDALLDRLFPEESVTEEQLERQNHLSHLTPLQRFYIPDNAGFDTLSSFLASESAICVVGGEKGCGKSALVANWLCSRLASEDYQFVYHLCGVGKCGNDAERCVDRIENEAGKLKPPSLLVVDGLSDESCWRPLSNYLFARKSYGGRPFALGSFDKVIVIDRYASEDSWDCDCFYEVPNHQAMEYWRQFIQEYLRIYGKKLSSGQIERILSRNFLQNASLMKVFLDEIVSFGSYERLNGHMDFLCNASDESGFYRNLLPLLEQEYGENLVKTALCLLIVSLAGIPESVLMAATCRSQREWSPLYCSLKGLLVPSGICLRLADSGLIDAARQRYRLDEDSEENRYRQMLLRVGEQFKSPYSFIESSHQLQLLGRYDVLFHHVVECQSEYGVSEDAHRRVLTELIEKECSRAEGADEVQFKFVVRLLDILLPELFNKCDCKESVFELCRIIGVIPFLLEGSLILGDSSSFDEERRLLVRMCCQSKKKLTSLIDDPEMKWKGRLSEVLTELDDVSCCFIEDEMK